MNQPAPNQQGIPLRLFTELVTLRSRPAGASLDGGEGEYEVTISFRHPIQDAGYSTKFDFEDIPAGDSGIGIPQQWIASIETPDQAPHLAVTLTPNADGRIGRADAVVVANTFGHALSIVHNHLGVLLSQLAFQADGPIVVWHSRVVERATGSRNAYLIFRGQTRRIVGFPQQLNVPHPFFRAAFSIYREGLGAINPFYALLCFFRVSEGSRGYIGSAKQIAKQRGLHLGNDRALVEDLDEVGQDFPEWIGRSCYWALDELNKTYRVPVAHGLTLDESLHAADQVDQETRYWKAVPIARQVARKLLMKAGEARAALGGGPIQELGES